MYDEPTQIHWRSHTKDVDAGRVVFTSRVKRDGAWRSITSNEHLSERRNFARCAIDLLVEHPNDEELPKENQCSFYCHYNCKARDTAINDSCVKCSDLPPTTSGDAASSAEYY